MIFKVNFFEDVVIMLIDLVYGWLFYDMLFGFEDSNMNI